MDNELLDTFTYKLLADIPLIKKQVSTLTLDKSNAVAKLFRAFHNYKASASYLELNSFYLLVSQGERILNALRSSQDEVGEHDLKWLSAAVDQMQTWCNQLLVNEKLSAVNPSLFPSIAILNEDEKTAEVMQGLTLCYADHSSARAQKMKAPLEHIFKSVHALSCENELKTAVLNNTCDIVILNMLDRSVEIAEELLNLKPSLALITAVPELNSRKKSRLLIKGLTHPIISPIKSSDLKRQLHNVVTSHFSKVYTIISHKMIYNFIQGLDPLPSSVKEISALCQDPESSIKDLIQSIESDPITTANILHATSMPIYAVKQTSSVEKAVVSFGKRLIKALTLSDFACSLGNLRLRAYNITEEEFKRTSQLRLALMNTWYSRVNAQDLDLLCSSSILGNLGQILINRQLISQGLTEAFQEYGEGDLSKAEVTLLKTSAAFVTADLLEFWGLDMELVDSIRYSDSPFNASTPKVQQLACANAVVYKIVTPYGELQNEIPADVKALMQKAGLKLSTLEEAIDKLSKEDTSPKMNLISI